MKKCTVNQAISVSPVSFLSFLLVTFMLHYSCRKIPLPENRKLYSTMDEETSIGDETPLNQLVVWVKPGIPREKFFRWRDSIRNLPGGKGGPVNISKACGDCDSSLMLLTGKGIETYIEGHTVTGGVGTSGTDSQVSGDTSAVYYSLNYRVNRHPLPPASIPNNNVVLPVSYQGQPVKVGVLDTGVDTFAIKNYPYIPDSASCIKAAGADLGWNFVDFTRNTFDDEFSRHGSTVTRFITDQFGSNGAGKVQILPVKTHDASGQGNLFDILCAMAYAKQRGAKIINASFGFYLPVLDSTTIPKINYIGDPNVRLLKKYIYHYLTKNNILLIAAAGNKDTDLKRQAFAENDAPYIPNNPQMLTQVPFYPACLAKDPAFPNVLAVTTVYVDKNGAGTMSDQNYSNEVVDIGVIADTVIGTHYLEKNPRVTGQGIEGSSYATPIVTGKIALHYHLITTTLLKSNYTRADLLNALLPVFSFNADLKTKLRNGRVMKR